MSRKTIAGILAVIGTILTYFQESFGLSLDATAMMTGVTVLLLYVLFEAKLDFKRMSSQAAKFADPKFWTGLVAAVLAAVNTNFGLGIPVELIIGVLGLVMSLLFKKDSATVT